MIAGFPVAPDVTPNRSSYGSPIGKMRFLRGDRDRAADAIERTAVGQLRYREAGKRAGRGCRVRAQKADDTQLLHQLIPELLGARFIQRAFVQVAFDIDVEEKFFVAVVEGRVTYDEVAHVDAGAPVALIKAASAALVLKTLG